MKLIVVRKPRADLIFLEKAKAKGTSNYIPHPNPTPKATLQPLLKLPGDIDSELTCKMVL